MSGVTLIELLVVLTVLGVVAAVSGVGLATLRPPAEGAVLTEIGLARSRAILSGEPVVVVVDTAVVRLLPDGRVLGSVPPGVDAFTGGPQ